MENRLEWKPIYTVWQWKARINKSGNWNRAWQNFPSLSEEMWRNTNFSLFLVWTMGTRSHQLYNKVNKFLRVCTSQFKPYIFCHLNLKTWNHSLSYHFNAHTNMKLQISSSSSSGFTSHFFFCFVFIFLLEFHGSIAQTAVTDPNEGTLSLSLFDLLLGFWWYILLFLFFIFYSFAHFL